LATQYDYIIAGAGAAGLSLAWQILQSPLNDKKILIVDADLQPKHDKTWCFWDTQSPPFEEILHKSWQSVEVSAFDKRFTQPLTQYSYHCLRSVDFSKKILTQLATQPQFELLEADIKRLSPLADTAALHTTDDVYEASYIFQSCFEPDEWNHNPPDYPLLQHFLGWEIQIQEPLFEDSAFTLMDFDETFSDGLAFMYLLPWSKQSGLIEYTVFSDSLLDQDEYKEKISLYLNNRFGLTPIDYELQRREFGQIPMQDRPETPWYKPRILNLGTVGGLTKPSTGYTFRRIQEHSQAIIEGLLTDGHPPEKTRSKKRFRAYDLWLLQIIHDHPEDAKRVFQHLLSNNTIDELFRFLGEESNILQDLKIMNSVPYWPFIRAIWKTMGRLSAI